MINHGGQIGDRAGRFVVHDRHLVAAGQKGLGQVAADKTRSAGDREFSSWIVSSSPTGSKLGRVVLVGSDNLGWHWRLASASVEHWRDASATQTCVHGWFLRRRGTTSETAMEPPRMATIAASEAQAGQKGVPSRC